MLYISQQINYDYIKKVCGSDFFQDEVHVGNDRHLIFATPEMLANLKNAKTWYGDGTFKIVQSLPFSQLYSICFFCQERQCCQAVSWLPITDDTEKKN